MWDRKSNRCRALIPLLGVGLLLNTAVGRAQQVMELKPNITALPAHDISVGLDFLGRPELRFAVTTANLGDGAMELRAGETGSGMQNVYQRVYLSDGSFYDRTVGSFIWHPEHNHFHVESYADYILKLVGSHGNSQRIGTKTSFCGDCTSH